MSAIVKKEQDFAFTIIFSANRILNLLYVPFESCASSTAFLKINYLDRGSFDYNVLMAMQIKTTMRIAIILILIFCKQISFSQDTIFFDSKWKQVSRINAEFFRIEKKQSGKWVVTDYFFRTKKLQMKGAFSSLTPEIKDGYFEWYHSNGKLKCKGNFAKNRIVGELLWFDENGNLKAKDNYRLSKQIMTKTCFYDDEMILTDSIFAKHIAYCTYKDTISNRGTMRVTTISGHIESECEFSDIKNQKREGISKFYFNNGQLKSSTEYVDGVLHGEELLYHDNGQLKSSAKYLQGKINGEVTRFYSSGQLRRKDYFEKGYFMKGNCYTATGQDTTHFAYETNPEYPGGESELLKFIFLNVKYPKEAKRKQLGGRVLIGFTIDKNGIVKDQHVIKSVDPLLDNEALRIISLLKKWSPGKQDGEKIDVGYVLPFSFSF